MSNFGVDRSGAASGTGVPTGAIAEALINAKGDLIAGTAADTPGILTVGANDTVLLADSAQTTGLKWANGATARTALSAAKSGANTDITSLSAPALGAATATTAAAGDSSTLVATTAFVAGAAFTTGDVKMTIKTVADTGWVLMNDGTIGDGSSGGTTRANADTSALFTLLWNNTANADCAVSTGRGANAAADFAAHKTIALPKALGRAMAVYGAGSGLTSRAMAAITGVETHTLSGAESGTSAHAHGFSTFDASGSAGVVAQTAYSDGVFLGTANTNNSSAAAASSAHQNMQPSLFINIMIKL